MTIKDQMMVDIETLSTRPNAALIAIGAVMFDPYTVGAMGAEFFMVVDFDDAIKHGRVDGSTIKWWMSQEPASRAVFENGPTHYCLADVLHEFEMFWRRVDAKMLWCHGANFDEPVLHSAFLAVGKDRPWRYNAVRDDRTLLNLPGVHADYQSSDLVPHNPLHDAKRQAMNVQIALKQLRVYPDWGSPKPAAPAPNVTFHKATEIAPEVWNAMETGALIERHAEAGMQYPDVDDIPF